MAADIIVTVVAGILLAVALFGTVFPVLPGSPVAIGTLLVWGWVLGSTESWVAAGLGILFCVVGWSASALLAGRKLKQQRIPKGSILAALVTGVIGAFVLPFLGLFLGFAAGLFLSEYLRRRDLQPAFRSSIETLKAMGLGMLIEFFMVSLAASVWVVGVAVHFATAS